MEPFFTLDIRTIILTIGAYQGMVSGILLWVRQGGNRLANRLLGGLLFLMGMAVLNGLLIFSGSGMRYPILFRWTGVMSLMYGPIVYFYIRAYISRDFQFQLSHLWHLFPLGLTILMQTIFAETFQIDPQVFRERFVSGIIPPLHFRILGGAILLHVNAYLFASVRLTRCYRKLIQDSPHQSDQIRRRWLSWIMFVLLVPVLFGFLANLVWFPATAFTATLMILVVFVLYLVRPAILDGIPPEQQVEEADLNAPRYESSPLSAKQKDRYYQQLRQHMEQTKPYRQLDLSLSELATQLDLHPKYLSQTINELGEQNFTDFVNGYRIREAQKLLRSPRHQHFTILAISQEVGFKSRSAFYVAFKKQTGMTPTAFRKSEE